MQGLIIFSDYIYDLVDVLDDSPFYFELIEDTDYIYLFFPEQECYYDFLESELTYYLNMAGCDFNYRFERT